MGARAVIFLIVFIDLIGFGIVLPMLPVYAEHFGASGFIIGIRLTLHRELHFMMK